MNHTDLQRQVEDLLPMVGWRWLHVRKTTATGGRGGKARWTTTTNVKGWPDLAPLWSERQPGRIVAVEVKVPPDWLSTDQVAIRRSLERAGWEFYVLTPAATDRSVDVAKLATILRAPRQVL